MVTQAKCFPSYRAQTLLLEINNQWKKTHGQIKVEETIYFKINKMLLHWILTSKNAVVIIQSKTGKLFPFVREISMFPLKILLSRKMLINFFLIQDTKLNLVSQEKSQQHSVPNHSFTEGIKAGLINVLLQSFLNPLHTAKLCIALQLFLCLFGNRIPLNFCKHLTTYQRWEVMPHKPHMVCKKWTHRYNADAGQQAWQHFMLAHRVLHPFNPQVHAICCGFRTTCLS